MKIPKREIEYTPSKMSFQLPIVVKLYKMKTWVDAYVGCYPQNNERATYL